METFEREVAIIGISGRFPGAPHVDSFWRNLRDGIESIAVFSNDELLAAGVDPALVTSPHYIPAYGWLEGFERFDAAFFGYSPREAELIDPQHRLFLECAWEALEDAGYDPETYPGRIGVYGGVSQSSYAPYLQATLDPRETVGGLQIGLGTLKDFLTTRVSYKLNLTGPSVVVQSACSTSLVAIHFAYQSLLIGECDMVLVGGASIHLLQKQGVYYEEKGIVSPDGHCRAFDARAAGTSFGDGVGVVLLKRLTDALAEGDAVYAVIKGSAVNNDGARKIGYTAPSVAGQAEVISEALALAGVEADTVSYIETHGTGTPMGDPIEVEALTEAFRSSTTRRGFCALGSVKTNVGHLDAAAGVTSLIKTALALKHHVIPPSLHFEQPNPKINFENSPFYVNAKLAEWPRGQTPRRAGVNALGVGGTNAHVVLEEAPERSASTASRPWQLLVLSARTEAALNTATQQLADHLTQNPEAPLPDIAYTLQVGRRRFAHRRALVCRSNEEAKMALGSQDPQRLLTGVTELQKRSVVFMFPGGGSQYLHMGADLYHTEAIFREQVDHCAELLSAPLGLDLRTILYPAPEREAAAAERLQQSFLPLPALFVIEYALAQLWRSWGIQPEAMLGHSLGEYVAACLSGVISLEAVLKLVILRGQLIMRVSGGGAMLSVSLSESELRPLLGQSLDLAAINAPTLCVVSGPLPAVEELDRSLTERGIKTRRLRVAAAGHSAQVEPILKEFADQVAQVSLQPPQVPYLSNVTGTWITAEEATSPAYWARHLRETVRFADGLQVLWQKPNRILLEVGPGQVLSTFANQASDGVRVHPALPSMRHPKQPESDAAFLLTTLGKLWLAGVQVDWKGFYNQEQRQRVRLPTYPFERQRYWVDPGASSTRAMPIPAIAPVVSSMLSHSSTPESSSPMPEAAPTVAVYTRPNLATAYVAPRNDLEQVIAILWQELLGVGQVGVHDSFFELGGHSLMATQIVAQLKETYSVDLPLEIIFENSTIATLAASLEAKLIEKIEGLSEEDVQRLAS